MNKADTNILPPVSLSDQVRDLELGHSRLFKADPQVIRTIVSRVRSEYRGRRAFQTAKEKDGLRVWRTT